MVSSSSSPPPPFDASPGPGRLQIALALAVVRSKPAGVTVRDHILQLRQHVRQGKQLCNISLDHHSHLDQLAFWKARYDESAQRCQELERRNVQLERWRLDDAARSGLDVIVIEDETRLRPGTPRPRTPRPSTPRPSTPRPGTAGGSKRKATGSNMSRSPKRIKHPTSEPHDQGPDKVDTSAMSAADDGEIDKSRETLLQNLYVVHKMYMQETLKPEATCFGLVETARAIAAVVATIPRHYDRLAVGNLKGTLSLDKDRSELSSMIQTSTRAWVSLTVGLKKLSDGQGSHLPSLVVFECVNMFKTIINSVSDAARQIAHLRCHSQVKLKKGLETTATPKDNGPFRAVAQFLNVLLSSLKRDDRNHREIFEGVLFVLIERVSQLLFYFTFDRHRSATIEGDITLVTSTHDEGSIAKEITEAIATRLEAQCLVTILDRAMGLAPYHMNSPLESRPSSSSSRRTSNAARLTTIKRLTPASNAPLIARARDKLQRTLVQCMFGEEEKGEFAEMLRMPRILGPLPKIHKVDDSDVGDWFNGEIWRLVGWDLLGKGTQW